MTWLKRIHAYAWNATEILLYKILYGNYNVEKEIHWLGSAYDDLLAFPTEARRQAGFQLAKVQAGLDPEDWKPFSEAGRISILQRFVMEPSWK